MSQEGEGWRLAAVGADGAASAMATGASEALRSAEGRLDQAADALALSAVTAGGGLRAVLAAHARRLRPLLLGDAANEVRATAPPRASPHRNAVRPAARAGVLRCVVLVCFCFRRGGEGGVARPCVAMRVRVESARPALQRAVCALLAPRYRPPPRLRLRPLPVRVRGSSAIPLNNHLRGGSCVRPALTPARPRPLTLNSSGARRTRWSSSTRCCWVRNGRRCSAKVGSCSDITKYTTNPLHKPL